MSRSTWEMRSMRYFPRCSRAFTFQDCLFQTILNKLSFQGENPFLSLYNLASFFDFYEKNCKLLLQPEAVVVEKARFVRLCKVMLLLVRLVQKHRRRVFCVYWWNIRSTNKINDPKYFMQTNTTAELPFPWKPAPKSKHFLSFYAGLLLTISNYDEKTLIFKSRNVNKHFSASVVCRLGNNVRVVCVWPFTIIYLSDKSLGEGQTLLPNGS